MSKDRAIGIGLVIVGIAVILFYLWGLFFPSNISVAGIPLDLFLIKLTVFLAVVLVMGLLAWIGYTLATTPPPKPIEEIEKEIEEELKKLEKEVEEGEKKEEASEESEETGKD